MSRTPGSGWGAGPILWQLCPICGKKKAYYDPLPSPHSYYMPFRCTSAECKKEHKRFDSETLLKISHIKQIKQ